MKSACHVLQGSTARGRDRDDSDGKFDRHGASLKLIGWRENNRYNPHE